MLPLSLPKAEVQKFRREKNRIIFWHFFQCMEVCEVNDNVFIQTENSSELTPSTVLYSVLIHTQINFILHKLSDTPIS